MRRLAAYTLCCAVVLGLFTYDHFYGRSLFDDMPDKPGSGSSGGSGGGSGFFYTGASGGSHK